MSQSGPRAWFTAGMFLLASVGFVLASGVRQRQQHTAGVLAARREYLAHLSEVRGPVRDTAGRQRDRPLGYPDPAALSTIAAEGSRVWERRVADADFLQVRMGAGRRRWPRRRPAGTAAVGGPGTHGALALRRFLSTHQVLPELPDRRAARVGPRRGDRGADGPARGALACCRRRATHRTTSSSPPASREPRAEWDWLKWLPHALHPHGPDAVGPVRLVAASVADLEPLLDRVVDRPRFGPSAQALAAARAGRPRRRRRPPGNPGHPDGGSRRHRARPPSGGRPGADRRLGLGQTSARGRGGTGAQIISLAAAPLRGIGRPLSTVRAEAVARRLAPAVAGRPEAATAARRPSSPTCSVWATARPRPGGRLAAAAAPRPAAGADRRRRRRRPVELDLKESAQDGMGPHGLLIGATGSGKSELLRTLVLGAGR